MTDLEQSARSRSERIQRTLMVWGALILFAVGFLLLLAPRKAAGAQLTGTGDNEMHQSGIRKCSWSIRF